MNELASYTERVRQIAPDLTINSVSTNSEGLLNDVLVVNRCGLMKIKSGLLIA